MDSDTPNDDDVLKIDQLALEGIGEELKRGNFT